MSDKQESNGNPDKYDIWKRIAEEDGLSSRVLGRELPASIRP